MIVRENVLLFKTFEAVELPLFEFAVEAVHRALEGAGGRVWRSRWR